MANMSESANANRMMYREWFPVDHVQPSPDRAGRRGAVRAAVPRSVQLQLRSAGRARHRHGGRGDPHAARGRREARRGDAVGHELLDVVQRRHPHHVVLSQPDRHPDRNDRQPDAGRDPVRPRHAAAARRRAESDSAAYLLFQRGDRVLGDEQLRDSRHRVEAPRRLPVQHVQDGEERHRQGQPRQLDDSSQAHRGRACGDRCGAGALGRRREHRAAGGARRTRRWRRPRRRADRDLQQRAARSEDCATRAASSCRRTSRISRPRRSSSTCS